MILIKSWLRDKARVVREMCDRPHSRYGMYDIVSAAVIELGVSETTAERILTEVRKLDNEHREKRLEAATYTLNKETKEPCGLCDQQSKSMYASNNGEYYCIGCVSHDVGFTKEK